MDVTTVWNIPAVVASVIAGALYMPVLWWSFVRIPLNRTHRGFAALVGANALVATVLFTISQAIAALWSNDPLWPRVIGRGFLWLPFVVALVLGLVLTVKVLAWRTRR